MRVTNPFIEPIIKGVQPVHTPIQRPHGSKSMISKKKKYYKRLDLGMFTVVLQEKEIDFQVLSFIQIL